MAITRERVAEQLYALRTLHGTPDKPLSQEKAAQRAEVSTRDWQRWEAQATLPRTGSLSRVAEAFDIPLESFDNGTQPASNTPLADRLELIERKLDLLLTAAKIPAEAVAELRTAQAADARKRLPDVLAGREGQQRPQKAQKQARSRRPKP